MIYLDGIAVVLSGIEDLEPLIHPFIQLSSPHIFIGCVSTSFLDNRDTTVTETDMIPSHM